MNVVLPYHRGVFLQKGRGIGGIFSSLFRTLLPIGKAIIKSTPAIVKNTAKGPIGRKIRKSATKVALNTAKNLIESGDINKTFKKKFRRFKKRSIKGFKKLKRIQKKKIR